MVISVILLCCCNQAQAAQEGDYTYTVISGGPTIEPLENATPDAIVRATIAAFAPLACTMSFTGVAVGTPVGDIAYTASGTASIAADKIASASYNVDLSSFGKTSPKLAAYPFSEIVVGPEADGLAAVSGAVLSEEGGNYVLTVTGAKCPVSLQKILDEASKDATTKMTFNVTCDYIIKIEKTSCKVVSVDFKGAGKILTALGDYNTSFTGTVIDGGTEITGYTGTGGDITIPSTLGGFLVTTIGANAFENCTGITSVTVPKALNSIGDAAFKGCSGLTNIIIPENVASVNEFAFKDCSGLKSITFYSSGTEIGNNTDPNNNNDTVPETTKIIGYYSSTAKTYADEYNRTFEVMPNICAPTLNGNIYEIQTADELAWISYKVMTGMTFEGCSIKLMDNIDLAGRNWIPIGGWNGLTSDMGKYFSGTFDGNGYIIKNLTVNANHDYAGLLGYIQNATIKNVGIINASVQGGEYVGGLVGLAETSNSKVISGCYTTGTIVGTRQTGGLAGAVFGQAGNNYVVCNCYSRADVNCSGEGVGGLIGEACSITTNCYATGDVCGSRYVGGFAGWNEVLTTAFTNCYATGNVTGNGDVGGFLGYKQYDITINNCYWNSDAVHTVDGTILSTENKLGVSNIPLITTTKTSVEMQSENFVTLLNVDAGETLISWLQDTENVNSGYPLLDLAAGPANLWISDIAEVTEEDSVFNVGNATELAWIAKQVMTGNTFSGKIVKLTGDIDLAGKKWTPIGVSSDIYFAGIFDGDGNSISNMNVQGDYENAGLFGYVKGTSDNFATVKNVSVSGTVSVTTSINGDSPAHAAGVVGFINEYGNTNNLHMNGNVYINLVSDGEARAGGVIGFNGGTMMNCSAIGAIISNGFSIAEAGGIVGCNGGTIENSYANCTVNASAGKSDVSNSYAGGLVGYGGSGKVDGCYAKRTVSSRATANTSIATAYAGGLEGYSYDNISDSYSLCDVSAATYTGTLTNASTSGTPGAYVGGITGCTAACATSAGSIDNCYATGNLSATSDIGVKYIGGVLAEAEDAGYIASRVSNGYWSSDATHSINSVAVNVENMVGIISGSGTAIRKTSTDMKLDSFVTLLNQNSTNYGWTLDKENTNQGYPVLHQHLWGSWIIDKEPTTSANGEQHRECSICNTVKAETIPLLSAGSISGRVLDANENPIANANIGIETINGDSLSNSGRTNDAGYYIIAGLVSGEYNVYVWEALGWITPEYVDNVSVIAPNDTADINFMLQQGGSISGKVLDDSGNPIANASISVGKTDHSLGRSSRTDTGGDYCVPSLSSGVYSVMVNADGWIMKEYANYVSVTAPNDTSGINFTLQQGGSISGQVLDDQGKPISGAIFGIYTTKGDLYSSLYGDNAATGYYTITSLATGDYIVGVKAAGWGSKFYTSNVSVTAPNDTPDTNFNLQPGGSVSGRVLDNQGNPVVDARVSVRLLIGSVYVNPFIGVKTDANGNFRIIDLGSGEYKISVSAEGWVSQEYEINVTVTAPNDAPNINFNLQRTTIDECFIATAAFGSKFTWPVALLRQFRDQYLLTNTWGESFVRFYYRNSPPIAAVIATSQPLKILVRVLLAPIIAIVYLMYHPLLTGTVLVLLIMLFLYRVRLRKSYVQG